MQTIQGFLNNTVSDMKGGRESWRIFTLFGFVSLAASLATVIVH